jgi:hypothetical protein
MATYDEYRDHRPVVASGGSNAAGFPEVTVFRNVVDVGRLPATLEAGDVVEVLQIPANTFVHKVFVRVVEGETGTLNVGDGADVDGYVATANVGTTGTVVMGAGAFAAGKFYAAADTIDIEVPAAQTFETLRVEIVAAVVAIG